MKIFFISMGCAKNSVDSERLQGLLTAAGHQIVEEPQDAEVGIINTCAFIQDAVKENIDAILEFEDLKEQGLLQKIIVTGCIVNRYEQELRKEVPSVDLWTRAEEWDKIIDFLGGGKVDAVCAGRVPLSGGAPWSRYLKVGEGCETFCSYCTIPLIRGRLRSTPIPALVAEARTLCEEGAREICLVGQDLTVYGRDLYGEPRITELLHELDGALPAGTWIRLLYLHPDRVTHEFIDFILDSDKVLPYLDIPMQHIDDNILKAMNRAPASAHIRDIVAYARSRSPEFALRTTIMVGFPGETEHQFRRVLDFLDEAELDRVGAFVYSPEEGTKAAQLPDQVPEHVKKKRYQRLMEQQSVISRKRGQHFIGRRMQVLIEELDAENGQVWGRSYRDAPEVDGIVYIDSAAGLQLGGFADVKITDNEEYDLFGELE